MKVTYVSGATLAQMVNIRDALRHASKYWLSMLFAFALGLALPVTASAQATHWKGPGTYSAISTNLFQAGWNQCNWPVPDPAHDSCPRNFAGGTLWVAQYKPTTNTHYHGDTVKTSWLVTDVGGGYYTLKNLASDTCAKNQQSNPMLSSYLEDPACDPADDLQKWSISDIATSGAVWGVQIKAKLGGHCWTQPLFTLGTQEIYARTAMGECTDWHSVFYFANGINDYTPDHFLISQANTSAVTADGSTTKTITISSCGGNDSSGHCIVSGDTQVVTVGTTVGTITGSPVTLVAGQGTVTIKSAASGTAQLSVTPPLTTTTASCSRNNVSGTQTAWTANEVECSVSFSGPVIFRREMY